MQTVDLIGKLPDKEKVFLAAQLTQAVMSSLETDYEPDEELSSDDAARLTADRTYMVFGRLLEKIAAGTEPDVFPDEDPDDKDEDEEEDEDDEKRGCRKDKTGKEEASDDMKDVSDGKKCDKNTCSDKKKSEMKK